MEQEKIGIQRWAVFNQHIQEVEYTTDSLSEAKSYIKEHLPGIHLDLLDELDNALVWCSEYSTMEELETICE